MAALGVLLLVTFRVSAKNLLSSIGNEGEFSVSCYGHPAISNSRRSTSALLRPFRHVQQQVPMYIYYEAKGGDRFQSSSFRGLYSYEVSKAIVDDFRRIRVFGAPVLCRFFFYRRPSVSNGGPFRVFTCRFRGRHVFVCFLP